MFWGWQEHAGVSKSIGRYGCFGAITKIRVLQFESFSKNMEHANEPILLVPTVVPGGTLDTDPKCKQA